MGVWRFGLNLERKISLPPTIPFLLFELRAEKTGAGGGIDGFRDLLESLFDWVLPCPEEDEESSAGVVVVEEDRISALEILDRFRCPHCNSTSPPPLRLGVGSCCWVDLNRNPLGTPSSDELMVHDPPLNPLPAAIEVVVSSLDGDGLK